MSQSNNNTDCVPEDDRYKYFDDATVLEVVNLLNVGLSSYRVKESGWTDQNLMALNVKKTKSMVFNFSKNYQFTTDILLKNEKIEIVQQAKLLGLILTSDLKWDENTNYLVKDANKRMIMLKAAAKFTSDKQVLKQIYYSRIRCKLEQSAAVWSTSLTQMNTADLERVQKAAVRLINGNPYESY